MSADLRERIVREAMRWLGTPHHHRAAVLGAGVDCGQLMVQVFSAVGVIEPFDTGEYPPDWHLHRSEERYLGFVQRHAREVDRPERGDLVVIRFGRCFSHGGILLNARELVHAYVGRGVCVGELEEFREREKRFFTVVGHGG